MHDKNLLKFISTQPLGNIHQTPEWGEFQCKLNGREKFWIVKTEENGKIQGTALVIKQTLPFGLCWLYCPAGPLVDYLNPAESNTIFNALKEQITKIAREEKAVFFRFEPPIEIADKNTPTTITEESYNALCKALKARPAHAHYLPDHTLVIDLKQSEEEILKQMKPKGRYNIKVAQKNGVEIKEITTKRPDFENKLSEFYKILTQTTKRDNFSAHNQKFYADMLKTLGPDKAKLYLAELNGETIAGTIVTFYKDTAIYYFGASSNEHRNTMAPYLLQWHGISEAKSKGYTKYDFLGIAPENTPKHPLSGVTDFKLKFGGRRIKYAPAKEIVYRKIWYQIVLIRKLIKI